MTRILARRLARVAVVCVGVSLITAFLVSTSMATFMPIILKRVGVDPAVAAGPFVTTANDIIGS